MNVHNKKIADQYNSICDKFDTSRVRIWNNVKKFLMNKNKENENLLDCGCGNGKNMIFASSQGYICEGFDISENLLYICYNKGLTVFYQDVLNLRLTNKYDKIISIAVLHHLETIEMQTIAIINLCNCLCDNGRLLVSFWSKENEFKSQTISKNDSRKFVTGPNYVDWKLQEDKIIKRYYYIHDYNTIRQLANSINIDGIKYEIEWEEQNWFLLFYK